MNNQDFPGTLGSQGSGTLDFARMHALYTALTRMVVEINRAVPTNVDFGTADLDEFNIIEHLTKDDAREVRRQIDRATTYWGGVKLSSLPTATQVLRDMLKRETTLNLDNSDLNLICGQTRQAISRFTDHFSRDGKSVAMTTPNWQFWDKSAFENESRFAYFDATTPDRLVENFRSLAKRRDISALVLHSSPNPLAYELTEPVVREVDRIAQREGKAILVDDVLRGTRPLDKRDSIACWLSAPYVAEGMSHRFGFFPFGRFSYLLTPKNSRIRGDELDEEVRDKQLILTLDVALRNHSDASVKELEARNEALDLGLEGAAPEFIRHRQYPTHPTTLLTFPKGYGLTSQDAVNELIPRGIQVQGVEFYYPPTEKPTVNNALRVSVARMPMDRIYEGARILGKSLREIRKN
jgi:DNA-binding transcriptional MocR family regulator